MADRSTPEPFSVVVTPDRKEVAVVLVGELDVSCVEAVDQEVRRLRDVGFDEVVIDLRRLEFLDSSGLRTLLSLRNDAKRNGHHLVLVRGPDEVQRVFAMTATEALFDWRDPRSGARSGPRAPSAPPQGPRASR